MLRTFKFAPGKFVDRSATSGFNLLLTDSLRRIAHWSLSSGGIRRVIPGYELQSCISPIGPQLMRSNYEYLPGISHCEASRGCSDSFPMKFVDPVDFSPALQPCVVALRAFEAVRKKKALSY